jgi:hypothetical protein
MGVPLSGSAMRAFRLRRQALALRAGPVVPALRASILNAVRRFLARRRLARIVQQTRNSFECEQYRRRRAAALNHARRTT